MEKDTPKTNVFSPKRSIKRAGLARRAAPKWSIESEGNKYVWASKIERVGLIRRGLPYSTIEVISKRINTPVKEVLQILSLPQTTYNKKRREKSLLSGRDSETVLLLTELIDFGLEVFNQEEDKFLRWLKKPLSFWSQHVTVCGLYYVCGERVQAFENQTQDSFSNE